MMIVFEQDRPFVLSVELIAPTLQVPHQGPIQSTTKRPPKYPTHNVTFLSPKLVQVKQQHFSSGYLRCYSKYFTGFKEREMDGVSDRSFLGKDP